MAVNGERTTHGRVDDGCLSQDSSSAEKSSSVKTSNSILQANITTTILIMFKIDNNVVPL